MYRIRMTFLASFYKSPLALFLVPTICAVVFAYTDHNNRQIGIVILCATLTFAAYGIPAVVFALYYHCFFSGAQTTKVECKQYLGTLISDVITGTHRASFCYLLYLLDAPLPICLVGFLQFLVPCVTALMRFTVTAVTYISESPEAAMQKGAINVALWQRVVRSIVSRGKDVTAAARTGATSRYAPLSRNKSTSGTTRKSSLRAANVPCQVLNEGKHFNRVARGCLLPQPH